VVIFQNFTMVEGSILADNKYGGIRQTSGKGEIAMKKKLGALILSAVLAATLFGCGSASQAGNNRSILGDDGSTSAQNGTPAVRGTETGPSNNTGANLNPNMGNNPTVYDTTDDETFGVSYEQMLRNAHVHDSDGILTDGENSKS
jgi:hypothetical protein